MGPLEWEIRARGTFEQVTEFAQEQKSYRRMVEGLPKGYDLTDLSPFPPSTAIYFMDGCSTATVKLRGSGEEVTFEFVDHNTSVSASAPLLYDEGTLKQGVHLPMPAPLKPVAYFHPSIPDRYRQPTTIHLLQVISMNMRDDASGARLLIGLPYAEKYPKIFFRADLFDDAADAASHGVVSSLTDFTNPLTGRKDVGSNGFPARSSFAVFHLLESKLGAFFNKIPSVMELQPGREGKLALKLPPIPFNYAIINAPIPLFDVKKPEGEPVADLMMAAHPCAQGSMAATLDAWPWHLPNIAEIEAAVKGLERPKRPRAQA